MARGGEDEDAELNTIIALSGIQPNAENTDDSLFQFFQSWRKLLISGTIESSKSHMWSLKQQVMELSDDTPLLFNEHLLSLKSDFLSLIQDTQMAAFYWNEIFPDGSRGLIGVDENPDLGADEVECARFLSSDLGGNEKDDDVLFMDSSPARPNHPEKNERKRKRSEGESAPYSFESIQASLEDIRDGDYDWLDVDWEGDDFGRTNILLSVILSECTEADPSILEALDLETNSVVSIRLHTGHLETPTIHPADAQQPTCRSRFLECITSPFLGECEYELGEVSDEGNFLVALGRHIRERLSGKPKRCAVCGEPHSHEIEGAGLYPCQQESCQFVYEDSGFCVVASTLRSCAQAVDLHVRLAQVAANGESAGRVFEPFPTFLLRGQEIRGRNGIFHAEADMSAVPAADPHAQAMAQAAQFQANLAALAAQATVRGGRHRRSHAPPVAPPTPPPAPEGNKDLGTLRKALAAIPSASQMAAYAQSEQRLRDYLQTIGKDLPVYRVLNYVISSVRCRLWGLSAESQLKTGTGQQYLVASDDHQHMFDAHSAKIHYAFHGSAATNWYSILRNGLRLLSGTGLMKNGAAHGNGVYLATDLATSYNYSAQAGGPIVVAVCEVVPIPGTNKFNRGKRGHVNGGQYIVCDDAERVRLRWLLVFEQQNQQIPHQGTITEATISKLDLPTKLISARTALTQQLKAAATAAIRPAIPRARKNKVPVAKVTAQKTKPKTEVVVLSDDDEGDLQILDQNPPQTLAFGSFKPPQNIKTPFGFAAKSPPKRAAGSKKMRFDSDVIDLDKPQPLRRSTRTSRPIIIDQSPPNTQAPSHLRFGDEEPPSTNNPFAQAGSFSFGGANTHDAKAPLGSSSRGANTNQYTTFTSGGANVYPQPINPPPPPSFPPSFGGFAAGPSPFAIPTRSAQLPAAPIPPVGAFSVGAPPTNPPNPPVQTSNPNPTKRPGGPSFPAPPPITASSPLYKPPSRNPSKPTINPPNAPSVPTTTMLTFAPPSIPAVATKQDARKANASKGNGGKGGGGAFGIRQRLMREYQECTEQEELQKLRVSLVDDSLYEWEVVLPAASYLEVSPPLFNDLQQYADKHGKEDAIVLRVSFPKAFPAAPPFIRVVRPRFVFHTGHVTIGGSICLEMLTLSGGSNGWQPTMSVSGLLLLLHSLIAVDGKGRVDLFGEAREQDLNGQQLRRIPQATVAWARMGGSL